MLNDSEVLNGGGSTVQVWPYGAFTTIQTTRGNPVPIYRLILPGYTRGISGFDTGATLPGCSRENPNGCDPRHFETAEQITAYAHTRGEIPAVVNSVEEVWAFVDRENAVRAALIKNTAPSGSPVPGPNGGGAIYRFIVETSPTRFDTGANYPACSRTNPAGCAPMGFDSLSAAATYAYEHGEIPVKVGSVDEAWAVVGGLAVNPANIVPRPVEGMFANLSASMVAVAALGILWFFGKKR